VNRALFYGVGMKSLKILLFPVLALILSGCAGYRVGSTLDKSIKTVSLTIVNKTDEPSIEVAVMKALRAELQMDGRLEVRSQNEADVVLSVTLKNFELDALAFNRKQGSLAAEYRLTITASAVLSDAETGKVILENPAVLGESEFPYAADLTTTKRRGLPEAAGDLARKVVSTVVTAW
jgi:outer membrane lipopolysaccharide assembly protein LptE/RlpB